MKKRIICIIILIIMAATGCEVKEEAAPVSGQNVSVASPKTEESEEPKETPAAADYLSVQPYEVGQTMILMYHGIVETRNPDDPYQRTREEFRNDLQALYDRGYRLVALKDLVANNIMTAAGYTPVAITFDDGLPSSFSLVEENGTLVPTPGCGFDIMMTFAEEHPDFGMAATFFVNANPFNGAGSLTERMQFLVENGCDIGNHTYDHADLYTLTADGIQTQMAQVDSLIREALPGYEPVGVSYPYGKRPESDALKPLVLSGEGYHYDFGLRVGQSGGSSTPNRVGYDAANLPRVRGSHGDEMDLWWMLDLYDTYPERRYISDGNPDTIAVPRAFEENVAIETLGEKELVVYDLP